MQPFFSRYNHSKAARSSLESEISVKLSMLHHFIRLFFKILFYICVFVVIKMMKIKHNFIVLLMIHLSLHQRLKAAEEAGFGW